MAECEFTPAMAWVEANTLYRFDDAAPDGAAGGGLAPLPPGVAAFLEKFDEVLAAGNGVAAESIGGMSQRFTGESVEERLRGLAAALLPEWYKSARFVAM